MGALDSWRFCPVCGEAIEKLDDRVECRACGNIAYANAVPGAEAVCLDDEGRILLGRRAFHPGKGLWDLPGGFLHEDEHPLDALRREVREETALEIEPHEFLGFWLEPYDGRIVLCLAWTAGAHEVGKLTVPSFSGRPWWCAWSFSSAAAPATRVRARRAVPRGAHVVRMDTS